MSSTLATARKQDTARTHYDCIIVGGGHNGLVCATLLARNGRSVLLLEAAGQVGGAAVTREFYPGFRVSAGAHLMHSMPADLMRDLQLDAMGLQWAVRAMPSTALRIDAAPLALDGSSLAFDQPLTPADAAALIAYQARMRRFAAAVAPILASVPPRLGTHDWLDRLSLLRMAWQIRKLGKTEMREILRIGGMNVFDLLEEHFESPALKGALGLDAVLGTNFGPRSPGTVLTLLYRLAGQFAAGPVSLAQPKGGLGALCDALAKAATGAGVSIRTATPVAQILVSADRAAGVVLESGETIASRTVISNADPKTTFLKLVGPRHLDTGFVRRIQHIRSQGLAAKLHLALGAAPRFTSLSAAGLAGRLLVAPSLEYIERAFNHVKYGEYSSAPAMEITVPTINDPTLAPDGRHVLSAIVQYAPYALKQGWDSERGRFTELLINTLEQFAPGIRDSVLRAELLTPVDIEREFRMTGGHWHHGELAFDQFLMVRPVPGATQYATPLAGLFLCGAGCHPGGGVLGIAGKNAARQVLRQVN